MMLLVSTPYFIRWCVGKEGETEGSKWGPQYCMIWTSTSFFSGLMPSFLDSKETNNFSYAIDAKMELIISFETIKPSGSTNLSRFDDVISTVLFFMKD